MLRTITLLIAFATLTVPQLLAAQTQKDEAQVLMPAIPAFRTSALGERPRLILTIEPTRVPDSLPVFEILPPEPAERALRQAAEAFGLKPGKVRSDHGKLTLLEPSETPGEGRSLALFEASGGLFYMVDRLFSPPEKQPRLPGERQAQDRAVRFLEEHDLLPKDAVIDREAVEFARSVLTEFEGRSGAERRRIVASIEVRFPQTWGGYRVTGPGSKLYVALGEAGEILGVTRMWRRARQSGAELPSIQSEEALELLRRGRGRQSYPAGCTRAAIERMELAYWSETPRAPQRTALPVYRIGGTCTSADGADLGEFEAYAPAVRNASFPIRQEPTADPDEDEQAPRVEETPGRGRVPATFEYLPK